MNTVSQAAEWAADHTILLMAVTAAYGFLVAAFTRQANARLARKVTAWNTRATALQAQHIHQDHNARQEVAPVHVHERQR